MKKLAGALAVIFSISLVSNVSALPDRVGDFALLDIEGEFHQLSRYRYQKALVLMAYDSSCASIDSALSQFEALQSAFAEQQVSFLLINSSTQSDADELREQQATFGFDVSLLVDKGQLVSETLSFSNAGELAILDPERLTILYRGGVEGKASEVLNAELDGTVDSTTVQPVSGCELQYPAKQMHADAVPDYESDIAPIIAEQCASCHREGGIGPFALDSHLMLQGWSPMIREVLLTRRMPPTQVDPNIGHFSNARYIPEEDLQKLVHWIDAGAPKGLAVSDPLAALEFPDRRDWQLGEPDYVITAPRHEIPATGVLDYINVDVPLPFEEDKWVKAVQYIAGDESVLHHLLTYVTAPAEVAQGEAATVNTATRFLEGYAPGKVDAMTFPENTGVYIPEGYKLSMQFHYTTNGRATSDETVLGLYLSLIHI